MTVVAIYNDRPKCPVKKCRSYGRELAPGFYRCDQGHDFKVDISPVPPERAYARKSDPDTSKQAAASMTDERINDMQGKALAALVGIGGSGINDQIVEESREEWNAITPRMRPLERKGMVEEAGRRKSLRTGRRQIVWLITHKGMEAHSGNTSRR